MLNKNYMTGNPHLKSEKLEPFEVRIKRDKPELSAGVDRLKELLDKQVYENAFERIQTFNKTDDRLLIVSGGLLQRTFLERDCIPALKEAFGVSKVQIIG